MENVELGPMTTRVVRLVMRLAHRMHPRANFKATPELQLLALENEYRPTSKLRAPIVVKPFSRAERSERDALASLRSALYAGGPA
jgi:hypothetical protein